MPDDRTRLRSWWLLGVAGAIPGLLFVAHNVGYDLFYLLCLVGLWVAVQSWRHGTLSQEEIALGIAGLAIPLTALCSYWIAGSAPRAWAHIQAAQMPLAGIILVALVFRRFATSSTVWFVALFTGAVLGVLAIHDISKVAATVGWGTLASGKFRFVRASGTVNAVVFGGAAMVFAFMCAFGIRHVIDRSLGVGARVAAASALILCVAALWFSGTRGAWLGIPVVIVSLLVIGRHYTVRARVAAGVALILGLMLAYQIPGLQSRVDGAVVEFTGYGQMKPGELAYTSIGKRLEGWRLAWELSKNHPIWGAGPGLWGEGVARLKALGITEPRVDMRGLRHPHNEYLSALALRGSVGLVAELFLLAVLVRAFWLRTHHPDRQVRVVALAGIAATVGVLVLGLTDIPLGWWRTTSILYAFVFGAIYGAMRRAEENPRKPFKVSQPLSSLA